jgi:hypothetical protein
LNTIAKGSKLQLSCQNANSARVSSLGYLERLYLHHAGCSSIAKAFLCVCGEHAFNHDAISTDTTPVWTIDPVDAIGSNIRKGETLAENVGGRNGSGYLTFVN